MVAERRKSILDLIVSITAVAVRGVFVLLGPRRAALARGLLRERLSGYLTVDTHDGKKVKYDAGEFKSVRRTLTLFQKEPDTIAWLDSMKDGEVFWDIGANVGVYSIYLAGRCDARIYAFEPVFFNYNVLNRNIELNGFHDRITALCIALTSETRRDVMNIVWTRVGSSRNQFSATRQGDDREFDHVFKQGVLGFRCDDLIRDWGVPVPDHLKIDVDGLELQVLEGMADLLKGGRVTSLLVEVGSPADDNAFRKQIVQLMNHHGYELHSSGRINAIFNLGSAGNTEIGQSLAIRSQ